MSVLVENWPPVAVYADINLRLEYTSGTSVSLLPIDDSAPAYVPVFRVGGVPGEARMAVIGAAGLEISTAEQGIGGLEDAAVVADTGYDIYVLVRYDLNAVGAIACVHGTALTKPAGWGSIYASNPIRYFCVNAGASNTEIQPFVETAPRETYYTGIGADVLIVSADGSLGKEVVPLYTCPGQKRAFPEPPERQSSRSSPTTTTRRLAPCRSS